MEELRKQYEKLTKQKVPINMSKAMQEKYIAWFEQVKKDEIKRATTANLL